MHHQIAGSSSKSTTVLERCSGDIYRRGSGRGATNTLHGLVAGFEGGTHADTASAKAGSDKA